MRNATKLKQLLQSYSVCIDFEDRLFKMTLVEKEGEHKMIQFEAPNYSAVLNKAFSYQNKQNKINS